MISSLLERGERGEWRYHALHLERRAKRVARAHASVDSVPDEYASNYQAKVSHLLLLFRKIFENKSQVVNPTVRFGVTFPPVFRLRIILIDDSQ